MNKLIIALIFTTCIAGLLNASNYNVFSGNGTASSGNASVVSISNVSGTYTNVSQQTINAAKNYTANKLGSSYFAKYVSYLSGGTYGNVSYVYFSYNIPFANGSTTSGVFSGQGGAARLLGITITLRNTTVTGYIGPSKPYIINVSGRQALVSASSYGIYNGSLGIDGVMSSSNISSNSEYSIVWAVTSGSPTKGLIYPGVYVDSQNGKVVGEYMHNPAILSAQGTSSYGTAGNFSLFNPNNTQINPESNKSPDSKYIVPLFIIAIILLFVGLHLSRKVR